MNFKNWLAKIEESSRVGLSQNVLGGLDGMFGGQRTMAPVSWGINNRATASVIGGLGDARSKIRARDGAEPGSVPQFADLEDIRRSSMQNLYMPLQLPPGHEPGDPPRYLNRSMVMQARQISKDPMEDPRIYNVDDSNNAIKSHNKEDMITTLFTFRKNEGSESDDLETAVNFTTALMQASIMTRMSKYSHIVNLDHPQVAHRQMIPVPVQDKVGDEPYGQDENPEFNQIMMCSFVLHPKNKGDSLSGDIGDQLSSLMNTQRAKDKTKQSGISKDDAQRSISALSGSKGATSTVSLPNK